MAEVSVKGIKELEKNLMKLAEIAGDKDVKDGIYEIAKEMRDEMKARAPVGKTGNLRRGIVAHKFRRAGESISFAAIDFRIAPHAHLIEFGHGGPHPAPPHPFFRPVVNRYKGDKYKNKVMSVLKQKIKKTVR